MSQAPSTSNPAVSGIQGSVARADFAKTLGKMREWLDRNDCRLAGFETAADDLGTITVKALFEGNDVAEAFCRAFQGFSSEPRGANHAVAIRQGKRADEGERIHAG